MNKFACLAVYLVFVCFSCATLAEKGRMEKFDKIVEAYEHALHDSDFRAAAEFIDPAYRKTDIDYDGLKNFKVVDVKATDLKVSEDGFKVEREVEWQYFRLNRNILHTVQQRQVWDYHEADKVWLMETGLPDFQP